MDRKKELKDLIQTIRKATGLLQKEVSLGAGYEENSLTQALSKPSGYEPVIKQLKIAYKSVLENSTLVTGEQKNKAKRKKDGMPDKNNKEGTFGDGALKQILDGHLKLIQATADHAEAAKLKADAELIREKNYSDLIQQNNAFAAMESPLPTASGFSIAQMSDWDKYIFAKALKDELEAKNYKNVEAVVEDWSKHGAPKG